MSDRLRQGLAFVIAMGMVIAVASVPTVAQEVTGDTFEVAVLNAHTVDGKHAVRASVSKAARAGKLVATNGKGLLPSTIVKPKWSYIKGKPAGFKDGVDDVGVSKIKITTVSDSVDIPTGFTSDLTVPCPDGSKVIGGGFGQNDYDVRITDSRPDGNAWLIWAKNLSTVTRSIYVYATCMSTTPGVLLSSRGNARLANTK